MDNSSYTVAAPPSAARERGRVPARDGTQEAQKMKNRGNEAKEYLKIKDLTFLKGCKLRAFCVQMMPNGAPK